MTKRLAHTLSLLTLSLFITCQANADTRAVSVPIKLDYPLLHQLMVRQLFNQNGESAELLNDPSGCSQIVLTDPAIAPQDAELELS